MQWIEQLPEPNTRIILYQLFPKVIYLHEQYSCDESFLLHYLACEIRPSGHDAKPDKFLSTSLGTLSFVCFYHSNAWLSYYSMRKHSFIFPLTPRLNLHFALSNFMFNTKFCIMLDMNAIWLSSKHVRTFTNWEKIGKLIPLYFIPERNLLKRHRTTFLSTQFDYDSEFEADIFHQTLPSIKWLNFQKRNNSGCRKRKATTTNVRILSWTQWTSYLE